MLEGALGIRLLLLAGRHVPVPPSADAMRALARVEVTNDPDNGDGFQLTFACGRSGQADYFPAVGGEFDAMRRVIVAVLFGAMPEVLIDGVITHSQFNPGAAPGDATLTVSGRDLSVLMDLEERDESYENQADSVIVTRVLARYARHGIVPQATPTTDVPIVTERIPRQQETDLKFVQRLAKRNGYVFRLEPLTVGSTRALWGPQPRAGLPQPALSQNLGAATNVKSLSFTGDALAAVAPAGQFVEPFTKMALPIPSLPSLKIPPFSAAPAAALRKTLLRDTANQNPATAATRLLAETAKAPDACTAEGELDGVRYGRALRARRMVGVRGAGTRNDGHWYVRRVTHTIARGEYTQRFGLGREGSGATSPVVRT